MGKVMLMIVASMWLVLVTSADDEIDAAAPEDAADTQLPIAQGDIFDCTAVPATSTYC